MKGLDPNVPLGQVLLFTPERGTLMATKQESKYRTSTWWDVKVYCLEVGKAHNGYCIVHFSPNLPERAGKAFSVQVCWYPRGRGPSEGYLVAVSDTWPHIDHAAMTDLLMRLIYDLDAKLTRWEQEAKQGALF